MPLALDVDVLAVDGDNRDVLTWPVDRLQHFRAGHQALRDLVPGNLAGLAHNRYPGGVELVLVLSVDVFADDLAG